MGTEMRTKSNWKSFCSVDSNEIRFLSTCFVQFVQQFNGEFESQILFFTLYFSSPAIQDCFLCSMFPVSLNKLISRIFYSGFHSGLLGNRFVINWNIWYLCLYLEYFQFLELHCEYIFMGCIQRIYVIKRFALHNWVVRVFFLVYVLKLFGDLLEKKFKSIQKICQMFTWAAIKLIKSFVPAFSTWNIFSDKSNLQCKTL